VFGVLATGFSVLLRLLTRTDIETPDSPSERQAAALAAFVLLSTGDEVDASAAEPGRRPGPTSISPHPADDASADPSYGQNDPIPSGTRP